jgi:hypothetical protein
VSALDPASGLGHWHSVLLAATGTDSVQVDTLAPSGSLCVALPPSTLGTLYLSGLGRYQSVQGESVVAFPDLPAGWTGAVRLASEATLSAFVDSGHVRSAVADSTGFTRNSVVLDLPLAGGLDSTLHQVPLLVRLDSSWTGFPASLPDGSDLRLSLSDGTALPLTVAAWNRQARTGALWTLLDSLSAPGDSLRLVLSWGLPVPTATATSAFASADGWVAAWPLGDTTGTVLERLGDFPASATSTAAVAGPIGAASSFDGRLSQVLVPGSATGALDLPVGGPYTLSCWVRLADYGTSRFVMGRGENGYGLKFQKNFDTDTNTWFARDFRSSGASSYYTDAPADTATWTHLAVTVSDTVVTLYVNGTATHLNSGAIYNGQYKQSLPFAIGVAIDSTGTASEHFSGAISEVWVQDVLRGADWIRLTAANQQPGNSAKVR